MASSGLNSSFSKKIIKTETKKLSLNDLVFDSDDDLEFGKVF